MRRNKENTVMNGRLFQSPQFQKFKELEKPHQQQLLATGTSRRNRSMGNIFKRLDESLTRSERQRESHENLLNLSLEHEGEDRQSSNRASRRSIATLSDPNKPSSAQGRTFKLLQETLDNGRRLDNYYNYRGGRHIS